MELRPRPRIVSPLHFAAGGMRWTMCRLSWLSKTINSFRVSSKRALPMEAYEISIASTGEKAVALLDTPEGKYRALVTDINLGEGNLDGWDVARHAREIDPNFPIVYMSGKDVDDWASKGVPNSIMLAKPFAPAQLVTAISQLLNASPPIVPPS